jgi:hypothetical protein
MRNGHGVKVELANGVLSHAPLLSCTRLDAIHLYRHLAELARQNNVYRMLTRARLPLHSGVINRSMPR